MVPIRFPVIRLKIATGIISEIDLKADREGQRQTHEILHSRKRT